MAVGRGGGASRAGSNHPVLACASAAPPYPRRGVLSRTYVAVYSPRQNQGLLHKGELSQRHTGTGKQYLTFFSGHFAVFRLQPQRSLSRHPSLEKGSDVSRLFLTAALAQ